MSYFPDTANTGDVIERGSLKFVAVHGGSPPTWAPIDERVPEPAPVAPVIAREPEAVDVRASAVRSVQDAAATRHAMLIPDSPIVHDRKRREAREVIDNPAPDESSYPMLASMIEGPKTKAAFDAMATLVLQREQLWAQTAPRIEQIKSAVLTEVNAASSVEQINDIVSKIQWP